MNRKTLWFAAALTLSFAGCKNEPVPGDRTTGTGGGATDNGWTAGMTGTGATGTVTPPTGSGAENGTSGTVAARTAKATFESAPGVSLKAEATLEEQQKGVRIVINVEQGPPGDKAVHVHQKGDCSDIPGKSMGEHFAPHGETHGLPSSPQHHPGDLGNITLDKDGKGKLEIVTSAGNLIPNDPDSFAGRAIVIHTSNDKGTPPSGDAGTPIACAVIRTP
ncbi:MAG TPA: superoxide dismutase family protein [Polyangiaceae bacterium]|nr:superoxide dismutase family protein [Polyangiaceae bacterium]